MINIISKTRLTYVDPCNDERDYWDVYLEVDGLPARVEVDYGDAKTDAEILLVLNSRYPRLLEIADNQLRIDAVNLIPQLFKDIKEMKTSASK